MGKAAPKTQKTKASVAGFIAAIESDTRRKDAKALDKMMREVTDKRPAMWGPSIIGYGEYGIASGTWPRAGFSPRKAGLVVYLAPESVDAALLHELGKHKVGVSCLYLTKLADVDNGVLRALIERSWAHMQKKHPADVAPKSAARGVRSRR